MNITFFIVRLILGLKHTSCIELNKLNIVGTSLSKSNPFFLCSANAMGGTAE